MGGREARTFPTGVSAKPGQGHGLCSQSVLKEEEEFLAVVAEGKSCLCICSAANRWLRSGTAHYSAPALITIWPELLSGRELSPLLCSTALSL